jgi:ASC-1-like (ASCH) protein
MDTNKAHIVDNKDRHWILAEFDLDQQNIETRIKQSQREQMSRLENKLFERRATKAKVTELMRQDLNNKIEKELDLVMKMNIHEFILE